jgi:hypothetical protein
MGLKENLEWGEKAVAEVKKHVKYSSNNQRLDRLAALLQAQEDWKATNGKQLEAIEKAAKDAATGLRVSASVADKKKFFEDVAKPSAQPVLGKPVGKIDAFQVNTTVDLKMESVRGKKDSITGATLVQSSTQYAYDWWVSNGEPPDYHTQLKACAWAAKQEGAGNCGELAAIAFMYLEDAGVRPLDYMVFSNTPAYDHVWVVIGRANGSDPLRVSTWGAEAVWCDPWQMREGRVYSIEDLIKKKATNLDALFKLNSVELVDGGLPSVEGRTT